MIIDVVDRVIANDTDLRTKIVRLWAITELNYRESLGDKAWAKMINLTGSEVTSAIARLTGFCKGLSTHKSFETIGEKIKQLVPELEE